MEKIDNEFLDFENMEIIEGQGCLNDCAVDYWVGDTSAYVSGCSLKTGSGPSVITWW